jgi:hypothetical protein
MRFTFRTTIVTDDIELILLAIDELRRTLTERYATQQKALDVALTAANRALEKSERLTEQRFDAITARLIALERAQKKLPLGN